MIPVDVATTHGQAHARMQKALESYAVIPCRRKRGERGKVALQWAVQGASVKGMSNEFAFKFTVYSKAPEC